MENLIEDSKIQYREINSIMRQSYIDYSMSVIVGRALPDVRDGLKPVHRRILYDMMELGVTPDKPHRKSARIVGDVLGKYHPHGDSSVYDAMVRLAQEWNIRYPLVDGHGNFGSVDGDSPAAMRYTEARMTPLALQMLRDINKDTVDFMPNFDGDEREPVVLPSRYPNLLVNGSNGIAVGMATSIPPHNLTDVINAAIRLIEDESCTVEDLIKIVKAPDFPTGAELVGTAGAEQAYRTGIGKVTVRSKYFIEEASRGKTQIVFTEIPYQVNKGKIIEKIAQLMKEKKLDHISDVRDESDREGMRIVVELKKDARPQIIINRLFKHTQLQENFSMIMIALVDGQPKTLNLYQILDLYLAHQRDVVTRRTRFDLKKAEERLHILEGYLIALDNIDEVIRVIRSSYNDAKQKLMERFSLSDVQAQAILDMRLARLQGLEREKIEAEYSELEERIAWFNKILSDVSVLMGVIKDELTEIREKFGDARRTEIAGAAEEIDEADLIAEEKVAVTLTHMGYIKRMSMNIYKTQKRGGKGITGLSTRENDFVKSLTITSTHSNLVFVTGTGKANIMKAYEIPEANRTAKGTPIVNFLNLSTRERIAAVIPIGDFDEGKFLMFITKNGTIKKTKLSDFKTIGKNGIIAIKLVDDDELVEVKQTSGDDDVLIVTKMGKCIRFNEEEVRPMGRTARGVKGVKLEEGDEVVAMELASDEDELLVVTEQGYGKRTPVEEYTRHSRGTMGIMTYDKSKISKNGTIIGALTVRNGDEVMLISSDGTIIRVKVDDISSMSRTTQGVRIMKIAEGIRIISMAKVIKDGSDESASDTDEDEAGEDSAQVSLEI